MAEERSHSHRLMFVALAAVALVTILGLVRFVTRGKPPGAATPGADADATLPEGWMLSGMEDPPLREETAREIGRKKAVRGVGLLEQHAKSDPDIKVRVACLWALGELGRPEPVPTICASICEQDAGIRAAAAEALGKIEHDLATPALIRASRDKAVEVRRLAASALRRKPGPDASEALRKSSEDQSSAVRLAAVAALAEREDDVSRLALARRAVVDEDDAVRSSAAAALRRLGDAAVPHLCRALPSAQTAAGRKLGVCLAAELGGVNAAPGLIRAMEKAQEVSTVIGNGIYEEAVAALSGLGAAVVAPLAQAAFGEDCTLFGKAAAAEIFSRIGAPAAEVLSRHLVEKGSDLPPEELAVWVKVLGNIGDAAALPALERLAGHASERVRNAVSQAREKIRARGTR